MNRQFWKYLRGDLFEILLSILLSTLTILSAVALMGVSAYLIMLAGFHPSIAVLQVSIVGVRFFGISRSVFRYMERLVTHKVNLKVLGKIRVSIFEKISKNYVQMSDLFSSSDMTNVLINDINQMENLFVRLLSPFVVSACISVLIGIYLGLSSIQIAMVYLVGYLLSGILIPMLSVRIGKLINARNYAARMNYQRSVMNFSQFIDEAVFYQEETKLIGDLVKHEENLGRNQLLLSYWSSGWNAISFLVNQSVFIAVLILGVVLVEKGLIDLILIGVFSLVVITSFEVVSSLPSAAFLYGELEESSNRILSLEKEELMAREIGNEKPSILLPIRFQNLSYSFPNDEKKIRLRNINLEIKSGDKIAIIGENGAGKSTLLDILQGYRTNYQGKIYFNYVELSEINKDYLRSNMSFTSANPYLFDTTIRQNLLISGGEADDKLLIDLLNSVGLYHPPRLTLDTIIDEFGGNLSSGEIKRLSIAQSILRNREILILDEPFSNLDLQSINAIFQLISEKFSKKTIVLVTHQLFFLDYFDMIYVLSDGSIIQKGNKQELSNKSGKFQEFMNII